MLEMSDLYYLGKTRMISCDDPTRSLAVRWTGIQLDPMEILT